MDKRKKKQVSNELAIKAMYQIIVHMDATLQERDRVFAAHIASVISFLKEMFPDELTDTDGNTVDLYKKFVDKMNAPVKTEVVFNENEKFELDISGQVQHTVSSTESKE